MIKSSIKFYPSWPIHVINTICALLLYVLYCIARPEPHIALGEVITYFWFTLKRRTVLSFSGLTFLASDKYISLC